MKKQAIFTTIFCILSLWLLCSCHSSYTLLDDSTQIAITQPLYEPNIPTKADNEDNQEVIRMETVDLMKNINASAISIAELGETDAAEAIYNFAFDIFSDSYIKGENTMISPVSIISALGMAANGAENNTLEQMEKAFGIDREALNSFLKGYMEALPQDSVNKLNIANSIWIKNDDKLVIEDEFLQQNAVYYGAGAFKTPFNDETLKAINEWIEENTDGMIKDMLQGIPEDAIMYLINALSFNAEWQKAYTEHQVRDGIFTNAAGEQEDVELMYSSENNYFQVGEAQGFIKFYQNREYAFAALLPDEGIALDDYIAELDPADLLEAVNNSQTVKVNAAIPKFESEYAVDLSAVLQKLGITDAFDYRCADFTSLGIYDEGKKNIFINKVLHKTFITVDEKGTEAGAATVVEMATATALMPPEEIKTIYLDRPFLYMIIDCENSLPLFLGTVESIVK